LFPQPLRKAYYCNRRRSLRANLELVVDGRSVLASRSISSYLKAPVPRGVFFRPGNPDSVGEVAAATRSTLPLARKLSVRESDFHPGRVRAAEGLFATVVETRKAVFLCLVAHMEDIRWSQLRSARGGVARSFFRALANFRHVHIRVLTPSFSLEALNFLTKAASRSIPAVMATRSTQISTSAS
jgi:hypothetical protein